MSVSAEGGDVRMGSLTASPLFTSPPLPSPQLLDAVVEVLVAAHQSIMAAVCPKLIAENETESESRDRSNFLLLCSKLQAKNHTHQ